MQECLISLPRPVMTEFTGCPGSGGRVAEGDSKVFEQVLAPMVGGARKGSVEAYHEENAKTVVSATLNEVLSALAQTGIPGPLQGLTFEEGPAVVTRDLQAFNDRRARH